MFRLERLLEITDGAIVDADLVGVNGPLCYVRSRDGVCSLIVTADEWSTWKESELPHGKHVRWMSTDRLALWSVPPNGDSSNTVRAYTRSGNMELPIGQPRDIIFGTSILFACYAEEAYLAASEYEIESHLIAVFDGNGEFQFGLRDCLEGGGVGAAIEMEIGCLTESNEGIFVLYPVDDLWRVSPTKRKAERLHFPANVRGLSALSATEDKIFFARANTSEIWCGHLNRRSGRIEEEGNIPYSSLGILSGNRRHYFRIHGCVNGAMLITTDTGIWRVTFRDL
jgi:hypothetical protein